MNQESERVLSKVGELVEKEKLNPKQKYLRVKEAVDVWNNLGKYISDEFRNYINNELLKQNCAMWHVKMI